NVTGDTFIESTAGVEVGSYTSTGGSVDLLVDAGTGGQSNDAGLGQISAMSGHVRIEVASGDITNDNTDTSTDVASGSVSLLAVNGDIGSSAHPLLIDTSGSTTSVVYALTNNVYLNDVKGDLRIDRIQATTGDVSLVADGSIVDGDNDSNTKVYGVNISLTSNNGSIGTSTHDLKIDSSNPTQGVVNAQADQGVYLIETYGSLYVGDVSTTNGNIRLTVADSPPGDENLVLDGSSSVNAPGNIDLLAAGNVTIPAGASVVAGQTVTIT